LDNFLHQQFAFLGKDMPLKNVEIFIIFYLLVNKN
jgi:hypothetical protein